MPAIAFDTYKIVKRLRESGFSELQAEALTGAVQEATVVDLSHVATEEGLAAVKAELKADISAGRTELKADIQALKSDIELAKRDLTIRLGGMIGAGVVFLSVIKFFGH